MKILFVRHADPDYDIDSLTETGWKEAEALSDRLVKLDVKKFYCSPLGRAKDTASLTLKKLKDDAGNYLWRGSDDTIMGKPVMISEYMPNAEAGSKPILFGDFSYYWIVKRSPVTVKMLRELFALNSQVGYLAFELIDGRLVRREAVKALQLTA